MCGCWYSASSNRRVQHGTGTGSNRMNYVVGVGERNGHFVDTRHEMRSICDSVRRRAA